ncbi:MAG: sigma-54-dependent Fis family transcriptional regulator [Nitrososphaerota archaeon]|nr:sigma-54-dependent Fis family transcriptional regulator [Nitrososphaerota archaeon]
MIKDASPIIGSAATAKVYDMALKASKVDYPVLILGETGVGKEMVARFIHQNSKRTKNKELITLNCSAFPDSLVESELFGHVKGSFTGADRDKVGLVDEAKNGSLFLDEIGDMSSLMQAKLLRVLESGEYLPVGSTILKESNFRLIAATSKQLQELVKSGLFRDDLYYRIGTIKIRVPPLRDRTEEILGLARFFLNESGFLAIDISQDVLDVFLCYTWPGNVRELKHVIQYSIMLLEPKDSSIELKHLPAEIFRKDNCPLLREGDLSLIEREQCFRRTLVIETMRQHNGDYKEVCRLLRVSKNVIYKSMRDRWHTQSNKPHGKVQ